MKKNTNRANTGSGKGTVEQAADAIKAANKARQEKEEGAGETGAGADKDLGKDAEKGPQPEPGQTGEPGANADNSGSTTETINEGAGETGAGAEGAGSGQGSGDGKNSSEANDDDEDDEEQEGYDGAGDTPTPVPNEEQIEHSAQFMAVNPDLLEACRKTVVRAEQIIKEAKHGPKKTVEELAAENYARLVKLYGKDFVTAARGKNRGYWTRKTWNAMKNKNGWVEITPDMPELQEGQAAPDQLDQSDGE